jgi:nicotinate-nucleotide adenylyltransferase
VTIGLLGGAFDPIHNGHLFIAEAARQELGLERVVFVPTGAGNHRGSMAASRADRATMVRLAIAANPHFAMDETDLADDATGYTADLIPRLVPRYPGATFAFIVGGDSLVRSKWERLDEVLEQVESFVIAPRDEITETDLEATLADQPAHLRAKVRLLDLPRLTESATLVRTRLAADRNARYLIPEPVHHFISDRRLYLA